MTTAEMVKAAAHAEGALGEIRDHDKKSLDILEPQLAQKLTVIQRVVAEGAPFNYDLAEFHRLAVDVCLLRDRIRQIDNTLELIDRRLRKGKR